jgi:hypothetical protein
VSAFASDAAKAAIISAIKAAKTNFIYPEKPRENATRPPPSALALHVPVLDYQRFNAGEYAA